MWEVEYTDEFGARWDKLAEQEQETITDAVAALQIHRQMILIADRLYDGHLTALREEGEIP